MIPPTEVSAVLVTRGDVPMDKIYASIREAGITDLVVWNNAARERDLACYGRYEAIKEARNEWIFQQDDDLVSPVAALLDLVDPERDRWTIVANNRPNEEWPLTAIGCVFHRDLALDCFVPYTDTYGFDEDFCRICDVVFAYRNAYRRVWLGYEDMPWQCAPNSMYLQPDHMVVRERARLRTLELPDRVPA